MGLLARRIGFARSAAVFLGLCAVVLAIRVWEVNRLTSFEGVNFWTHTRIDSILFGSVLALWNNPVADKKNVLPTGLAGYAAAAALLLPTFLIRDEAFRQTYRYTLQGCGLLVLFNALIRDRGLAAAALNNPFTKHVAILSYTLYLVHSGLVLMFAPSDGTHPLAATLAAFAVAIGYAMLMHRWVERPLSRWRRHVEQSWAQEKAAIPSSAPSG
jgi:peptidoglycan/LPS O-acetylase OafA/YrhL